MHHPSWRTILTIFLVLLPACASVRNSEDSLIGLSEVTLAVDNRNFSDASIYASDGQHRTRVGRVTGKTRREFTFNWYQQDILMEIDFTGTNRTLRSARQIVVPGEVDDFLLVIGVSPNGPITFSGR